MAKKRLETKTEPTFRNFFEKHQNTVKKTGVVLGSALFILGMWFMCTHNSVQKEHMDNYVCQVIVADPDNGMIAMKCMVK